MKRNPNIYLKLAFNIAKVNLGKTSSNPSVGCVVVKDNSVISSGCTSLNGRPHAEFNALKHKRDFKDSDLYVTMEPCTHFGVTPPCTNIIAKKGVKRVFFSFNDTDKRTKKKLKKELNKKKIKVYKKPINNFHDFYQSYFSIHKNTTPYVDAKIATSRDYFTINKKSKWITNYLSRNRAHLIRSEYEAIISTSKSINRDNSLLNCRLEGFNNNKPDLIIVDLNLRIKTKLNILNKMNKRKIFIATTVLKGKKISYLKQRGIRIIPIKSLKSKNDFIHFFKILKNYSYNRILIESGLIFLNELLKNKLIYNLYIFKSSIKLGKRGKNNTSNNIIKKLRLKKKIKVNLNGDELYKVKIK